MITEPMTDARLAEIKARCEGATPGEWTTGVWGANEGDKPDYTVVSAPDDEGCWDICQGVFIHECGDKASWDEIVRNYIFIAAARTDLPDCLAEIERLKREYEELRGRS